MSKKSLIYTQKLSKIVFFAYLCTKIGISWQEIRKFAKHFGLGFQSWNSEADGLY